MLIWQNQVSTIEIYSLFGFSRDNLWKIAGWIDTQKLREITVINRYKRLSLIENFACWEEYRTLLHVANRKNLVKFLPFQITCHVGSERVRASFINILRVRIEDRGYVSVGSSSCYSFKGMQKNAGARIVQPWVRTEEKAIALHFTSLRIYCAASHDKFCTVSAVVRFRITYSNDKCFICMTKKELQYCKSY